MPANAHGYADEEVARLGTEIYERDIRQRVEKTLHGKVVAIDVESGDFAISEDGIEATDHLLIRRPDATIWLMRIGHESLDHFGFIRR